MIADTSAYRGTADSPGAYAKPPGGSAPGQVPPTMSRQASSSSGQMNGHAQQPQGPVLDIRVGSLEKGRKEITMRLRARVSSLDHATCPQRAHTNRPLRSDRLTSPNIDHLYTPLSSGPTERQLYYVWRSHYNIKARLSKHYQSPSLRLSVPSMVHHQADRKPRMQQSSIRRTSFYRSCKDGSSDWCRIRFCCKLLSCAHILSRSTRTTPPRRIQPPLLLPCENASAQV
jgi:hypothetical protein